jgi:four helix bundle protein
MAAVYRYEDLIAWQLSVELRDEVFRLTETGAVARNLAFRDQIRDSSSSPPRNIAEGFGRFKPKEFANFVRIALRRLLDGAKPHELLNP